MDFLFKHRIAIPATTILWFHSQVRDMVRTLAIGGLFCVAIASFCSVARADTVLRRIPGAGQIVDVAVLSNGVTVYLHSEYGPCIFNQATRRLEPRHKHPGRYRKYFERICINPKDTTKYFALAQLKADKSYGLAVYRYQNDRVIEKRMGRIRDPLFYRNQHGYMFVYSRHATEIRWFSHTTEGTVPIPLLDENQRSNGKWMRPLHVAEADDGTLAFYSVVDPQYHSKAIDGVLVFAPTADRQSIVPVQHMAMGQRVTGPACFTGPKTLRMINHEATFQVDLGHKTIRSEAFQPLDLDGENLVPVQLFRTKDGTLLSTWRQLNRTSRRYDFAGFDDGFLHRFAVWKSDRWELTGDGLNRHLYAPSMLVKDNQDDIWLSTCDGTLMRIDASGKRREFDWRDGISLQAISHMKIAGDDLWLFDRSQRREISQCLSLRGLRDAASKPHAPERSSGWDVFYVRVNSVYSARVQSAAYTISGRLKGWSEDGVTQIHLPDDPALIDRFGQAWDSVPVTAMDNRGGFWIAARDDKSRILLSQKGKWRSYDVESVPGKTSIEAALEARLADDDAEGLRVGLERYRTSIAFGPNRTIVYRNEYGQLAFFRNGEWTRYELPVLLKNSRRFEVSWIGDQLQAILHSSVWQIPVSELVSHEDMTKPLKWIKITRDVDDEDDMYHGLPMKWKLSPSDIVWRRRSDTNYVFATDEYLVFKTDDGCWIRTPIGDTPLKDLPSVRYVTQSPAGNWLFEIDKDYVTKCIVKTPHRFQVNAMDVDLGSFDAPGAIVQPAWTSTPKLTETRMRYRVDELPWSGWQPRQPITLPAVSKPGRHRLRLELRDAKRLSVKRHVEFPFSVTYDLGEHVLPLVNRLGSDTYQVRESATRRLIKMGPSIRDLLPRDVSHLDLETRTRLLRIIRMIE